LLVTRTSSRRITVPFHILNQVVTSKYGRLISDSGADTGALTDRYAHILAIHDSQVSVDGCHPNKNVTYNLCNGVVAVDLCTETYLLGMREVPLIPNSIGMLLSETQSRAFGIDIDSKPRIFGGTGLITIDESTIIPLHLEQGLMTCPIRKPTEQELQLLHIHWLTEDQPWDPSLFDEVPTSKIIVPRGYSNVERRRLHLSKASLTQEDSQELSRYFLYRPSNIITATLEATTRFSTSVQDLQMKRHFKSRFPSLNRIRLQETYATDTWFARTQAISGFTCAQIFYGLKSKFIVTYPMKREADGPAMLEDFIRDHGAPIKMKSYNSTMQSGKLWTSICRKYNIGQIFTEPHHPHQNQAERYIGEIKRLVTMVMDRTRSPDEFWALCAKYVTYIVNRMAHPDLQNRTPYEKCHGYTPDISASLHFGFYDPVYYIDSDAHFPSTRESLGRFVGLAENIGDALTYLIFDETTRHVIARSIVRSTQVPNQRLPIPEATTTTTSINQPPLLVGHEELTPDRPYVELDVVDHTGYPLELQPPIGSVVSDDEPNEDPPMNDDIDDLNEFTKDDVDTASGWKIEHILQHRDISPLKMEVLVKWDNGETTWVPLSIFKRTEPQLFSDYAIVSKGKWANHFRKKKRQFFTQL